MPIPTPTLDPLFIAYNAGADGGILRTICLTDGNSEFIRIYRENNRRPNSSSHTQPQVRGCLAEKAKQSLEWA